jgi:hypothetical protein
MSTFTEEYYDDDFNTSLLDIVNQDRLLLDLDLFPTVDDMLLWFDNSMTSPIINHVDVPEDTIIIRPINTIEPEEQEEETDDQDEEEHTPNLYYSG